MPGTMEGLSVPIYGAYYRYSADQTQALYVADNGASDLSFTSVGADNLFSITHSDTSTVATGYLQNFYASLTAAGTYTTGNTQISPFATDLTLSGTISCEAQGMYIYVAGSGTLTSANISGLNVYLDDFGGSLGGGSKSGIQIHIADGNTATGQNAFITMRLEGASGAATCMFEKSGTATNPTYFLRTNATDGMITAGNFGTDGASTYGLAVYVAGAARYIPLIDNT